MCFKRFILLFFLSFLLCFPSIAQEKSALDLSISLLIDIKLNNDWSTNKKKIEDISYSKLQKELNKDVVKYAFWINIYNAYIQIQLKEKPNLYEDRSDFFSEESIRIGELELSFDDIEHQILRKAEWKYGLGYIKNPFSSEELEALQVEETDYRIHFALNCGAKSCPQIRIYDADKLNEQLELNTKAFLEFSSTYNSREKEVVITALFSWFRGDFGGEKEVLQLLKRHKIIPTAEGVSIKYADYDWTLKLDNYVTN